MESVQSGAALICIGGLPGSGKTTFGLKLLELYGDSAVLIDPDLTRLEVLGRSSDSSITDADLTPAIHAKTVAAMIKKAGEELLKRKIVIVPSSFVKGEMRAQFENMAMEQQVPFYGFWLVAPVAVHKDRLMERQQRRVEGAHDITTISAVSHLQIDPTIITGEIKWSHIDATPSREQVFQTIFQRLPKNAASFPPA